MTIEAKRKIAPRMQCYGTTQFGIYRNKYTDYAGALKITYNGLFVSDQRTWNHIR